MHDTVIGIDPGSEKSALVVWNGMRILNVNFAPNTEIREQLRHLCKRPCVCAIESMSGYGMTMGQELIDTLIWIGRFAEMWEQWTGEPALLITRRDIKVHHCESAKATDTHIKQALEAKYGKPGTKKAQNLTYPLKSSHLRSAFAAATYVTERRERKAGVA